MRIRSAALAMAAVIFALFAGCNKGGSGVSYYMKASIGTNNQYNVTNCIARPNGNGMLIQGLTTSSALPIYPYISISIANWHDGLDSIPIATTGNYIQYLSSATQVQSSLSGVLVINSTNANNISGVFQFTCTDSTQVTNGSFVAKRTQ